MLDIKECITDAALREGMLTAASERLAAAAAGEAVQSRDHEEGLPFASDGHCRGTEDMCDGTDNEGRPELTMTMFNVPKVVSRCGVYQAAW